MDQVFSICPFVVDLWRFLRRGLFLPLGLVWWDEDLDLDFFVKFKENEARDRDPDRECSLDLLRVVDLSLLFAVPSPR